MSTHWRTRLHQAEPRIVHMIQQIQDPEVLDRWDRIRGRRWDASEDDAKFILKECVPILEAAIG